MEGSAAVCLQREACEQQGGEAYMLQGRQREVHGAGACCGEIRWSRDQASCPNINHYARHELVPDAVCTIRVHLFYDFEVERYVSSDLTWLATKPIGSVEGDTQRPEAPFCLPIPVVVLGVCNMFTHVLVNCQ
eukprot:5170231-Amphidinium_carterae.1